MSAATQLPAHSYGRLPEVKHAFLRHSLGEGGLLWLIHPELVLVYLVNYSGVTNSKLVTTNHGRQLRGAHQLAIACQLACVLKRLLKR